MNPTLKLQRKMEANRLRMRSDYRRKHGIPLDQKVRVWTDLSSLTEIQKRERHKLMVKNHHDKWYQAHKDERRVIQREAYRKAHRIPIDAKLWTRGTK